MYTTLTISKDLKRAIMVRSFHDRKRTVSNALQAQKRQSSIVGTKSYQDALQRAFNKAKTQIFFNPDMNKFITFTYAKADNTIEEVLYDIKMLIKKQTRLNARLSPAGSGPITPKYLFIMEYQKRGSIHVHMIANNFFTLQVNKNGYNEVTLWQKGFSSVLSIKDFDNNFRPYLYLFKYMRKSQRIGKSFIHASRNLNSFTDIKASQINLLQWRSLSQEITETTVETTNFRYFRNYLEFDATMAVDSNFSEREIWLEKVRLHSMREWQKLQENRSRL